MELSNYTVYCSLDFYLRTFLLFASWVAVVFYCCYSKEVGRCISGLIDDDNDSEDFLIFMFFENSSSCPFPIVFLKIFL